MADIFAQFIIIKIINFFCQFSQQIYTLRLPLSGVYLHNHFVQKMRDTIQAEAWVHKQCLLIAKKDKLTFAQR